MHEELFRTEISKMLKLYLLTLANSKRNLERIQKKKEKNNPRKHPHNQKQKATKILEGWFSKSPNNIIKLYFLLQTEPQSYQNSFKDAFLIIPRHEFPCQFKFQDLGFIPINSKLTPSFYRDGSSYFKRFLITSD
uniref:Uncharacterized protein n=1 Tax=Cacopsylla melanoneura TaxID=428564 RepID=A0A8D8ZFH6_9HEMI